MKKTPIYRNTCAAVSSVIMASRHRQLSVNSGQIRNFVSTRISAYVNTTLDICTKHFSRINIIIIIRCLGVIVVTHVRGSVAGVLLQLVETRMPMDFHYTRSQKTKFCVKSGCRLSKQKGQAGMVLQNLLCCVRFILRRVAFHFAIDLKRNILGQAENKYP